MDKFTFKTSGVCSDEINISIEDGKVTRVVFASGCEGNLTGIGKLVEGMTIEEVIKKLKGIDCEGKGTSCPDQLAKGLEDIMKKNVKIANKQSI